MPHFVTFDGLFAGPDKIENPSDGSLIDNSQLGEHAPKDSEYRPDNHVDMSTDKPDLIWVIEKAQLMEHAPKDSEYRPDNLIDVITGKPDSNCSFEQIPLMEHTPKDSEYRAENHVAVGSTDDHGGSTFLTDIFEPSAGIYSFRESLDSGLEPMLDYQNSVSVLIQNDNQLLIS